MPSEEEELNQLWSLFKDEPQEIRDKRQQVTSSLNENSLESFPSTMLVSTAFDELFDCFAIGGQVFNYYRYGEISYCEKQRKKLWFALRHGQFLESSKPNNPESARKVQEFYKQQLLEQKAKGSSEDVWDAREKPLLNPFKE